MRDLAGRVAVITGAGSGFGRAFAQLAARDGMKLVLADIQRDALDATVEALRAGGADAIGEVVDVARSDDVARLAECAYARHGAVHLLMNNAGVGSGGLVWENGVRDWEWVLGVNLMGAVHGIRHFVPRMLAAEAAGTPGHVVNTASIAGWLAPPLMGVYNVSKHAVVALTETLYHDLRVARSSLGVTLLCPAFVPTGIAASHRVRPESLHDEAPPTASQRMAQASLEKAVAGGRMTAEAVAEATFAAVREGRFYVFTHPQILASVEARFEAALRGDPPADPLAARPAVRPPAPPPD